MPPIENQNTLPSFNDRIHASYRLNCAPHLAESLARFIAYEQTVELPEGLIASMANAAELVESTVGRVEELRQTGENIFETQISYNTELASNQLGQLLNLLYGNVSMQIGRAHV